MLPDLPTKHQKKEADFGLTFRTWFYDHEHLFTGGEQFELKQTKTDRFNLKKIEPKQRIADKGLLRLTLATKGTADYKNEKGAKLYTVVKYPKLWCIININKINFNKISLTSNEAKEIAEIIIERGTTTVLGNMD